MQLLFTLYLFPLIPCCSEFEELEAVPTMAVMDGPLEPSSSTTSNVTDVPDDPSFVNFFSVRSCSLLSYITKTHQFSFFLKW